MRLPAAPVVGWGLIAVGAVHLLRHPDVTHALQGLSAVTLTGLILLTGAALAANGQLLRVLMSLMRVELDWVEWLGVTAANTMYNLVLPMRGGFLAKGYYLHRRHGLSAASFVMLTAVGSWFTVEAAAVVLLVAGVSLTVTGTEQGYPLLVSAVGLVVMWTLPAVLLARPRVNLPAAAARWPRLRNMMERTFLGLRRLSGRQRSALTLLTAGVALMIASGARLWVACHGLGYSVSIPGVLAVQGLVGVSTVLSITPGNLGVKEGVTAAAAGLLGLSTEEAVLAALVDRAASVVTVLVAGALGSRLLAGRLCEHETEC